MKRLLTSVILALVVAVATAGCSEKTVTVQSGEKVVCTYGETISITERMVDVPESEAGDYKINVKTITCAYHRKLAALYAAAQKALTDGDLKAAKESLTQVVALDAAFRKAAEQIKAIDAGQTPPADTTAPPSGTGGSGSDLPEAPVASLAAWVPDTLAGYTAQPIIVDPIALTREYLPTSKGAITVVVVVVEQYPSATVAKNRTVETIARAYSADRTSLTVEGRKLEFGTDGGKFAAIAWNEGSIGVAIEAASSGKSAAGLKAELSSIAAALIP